MLNKCLTISIRVRTVCAIRKHTYYDNTVDIGIPVHRLFQCHYHCEWRSDSLRGSSHFVECRVHFMFQNCNRFFNIVFGKDFMSGQWLIYLNLAPHFCNISEPGLRISHTIMPPLQNSLAIKRSKCWLLRRQIDTMFYKTKLNREIKPK